MLWETEVSDDKVNKTLDTTMDSGLRVAAMIHDNLVKRRRQRLPLLVADAVGQRATAR